MKPMFSYGPGLYAFDSAKFIADYLPGEHVLEDPALLKKWCEVMMFGINLVHAEFLEYRQSKLNELSYTVETIMADKMLNDTYPDAGGGIYTINIDNIIEPATLYNNGEAPSDVLYNAADGLDSAVFYNAADLPDYHCIVRIPTTLDYDLNEMKANIKKYNMVGIKFKIEEY